MEGQQYVQTLQVLQRIRDISEGQLNLPQICVVGDQTSGKSSLLEVVTGIAFPVKSGICTRAPIVVECCHKADLSEAKAEIQDPETKQYNQINMQGLDREITKIQKACIAKLEISHAKQGDAEDKKPKISQEEIRVRVEGPGQTDIVIVDLPGIINSGPGKEATRDLIRHYIREEQTLILLVSEAKQDAELTGAIDLAKEFDPTIKRTLRVLTKFDNFDSKDAEATAVDLVRLEESKPLGAHAVVCRSGGGNYNEDEEAEALSGAHVPAPRSGVLKLKARLPPMYAQLIQSNLPGLKTSATFKLQQAELCLKRMGNDTLDPVAMIQECVSKLMSKLSAFEETLTPATKIFQEAIHSTEEKITQEWVSEKLKENSYSCPFFQGEGAFNECLVEISEMWKPYMEKFINDVQQQLQASMKYIETDTVGVSKILKAGINTAWATRCEEQMEKFSRACSAALDEEADFGTMNHYLKDKYREETILPGAFLKQFVERFKFDELQRAKNSKSYLETALFQARALWVQEHGDESLHEHLEHRVFAAVKAAWAVEKKTFTDMVMKKSRDSIIKERKLWVQTALLTNKDIREAAVEDPTVESERAELKNTIRTMKECLGELSTIMRNEL